MIVFRIPQANVAAKNPAISMSCFLENKCGIQTGSSLIKSGLLNWITFLSRNFFRSDVFFSFKLLYEIITFYNFTQSRYPSLQSNHLHLQFLRSILSRNLPVRSSIFLHGEYLHESWKLDGRSGFPRRQGFRPGKKVW